MIRSVRHGKVIRVVRAKSARKEIHESVNLLCFTWQPKFGKIMSAAGLEEEEMERGRRSGEVREDKSREKIQKINKKRRCCT